MAMQMFKEQLNGKYDGVTAPTLLPVGGLSGGQNVRKVSAAGAWKPRKGVSTHNTTAIASASVLSMHQYTHPRLSDYHFLAQCNSNLYDSTDDPPASGTTFGSSIFASASSSKPGFSDTIGDLFMYADGGGAPVLWGGDEPFCSGFLSYDSSSVRYTDSTRWVTDNKSGTSGIVLGAASDILYVCSPEIAEGIKLDLGTNVNATARTATLKSWQSGAWSDRSATDGTASGGATLAIDGSFTWTRSANDTMRVLGGIMGYWYQISFSGALSNSVDVIACQVNFDMVTVSNKWDGVFQTPLAIRFYDQSAGQGIDYTGKLSNESTSQYLQLDAATTSDYIFVKSAEPLTGIGIGVVDGYENTGDSQITAASGIEHWDGDSWVTNAVLSDETLDTGADSSFAATGVVWWNATGVTDKKTTIPNDSIPGYWYKIKWDAAPDNAADDVRVYYIVTVPFPEALGTYDGVVEFKSRALIWGDEEFPNRLRYSCKDRPDCFAGADSGYTDAFGDTTKIICAIRFHNELLVFKAGSSWFLEGFSPQTFGTLRLTDTVGCCAAQTPKVIETGPPMMHQDEALTIAMWMDTDGVYALDGRKPKKISLPVDQYFNTEYSSTVIAAADLDNVQAFIDPLNNEYHVLLPNGGSGHGVELVYNPLQDEWYPPWDRTVGGANDYLVSGVRLRGTANRYHTYGGGSAGRIYRLENDTSDKDASDADVAITHQIKTRAISVDPKQSPSLTFDFRKAWIEAKAVASPATKTITSKFYKDVATSGTTITAPATVDLGNTGFSLVVDGIDTNQPRCLTFQLEFIAAVIDLEMEIRSVLYTLEVKGESDQ